MRVCVYLCLCLFLYLHESHRKPASRQDSEGGEGVWSAYILPSLSHWDSAALGITWRFKCKITVFKKVQSTFDVSPPAMLSVMSP